MYESETMHSRGGNNNLYSFIWLIIIFIFLLSSCVYDKELVYLNDQVVALNKRVTKLQDSIDTKLSSGDLDRTLESELEPRLKAIYSGQAEIGLEIEALKRAIDGLSRRIEDNEHLIKRAVEKDLNAQDAIERELTNLTQLMPKIKALEQIIKQQQMYLGLGKVSDPADQEEKTEHVKQLPIPDEVQKSNELELYDLSLAAFRNEKFAQSMAGFKDFLSKYPKSDRADNAQFWIGECYMALSQYEPAILAYQEVIKKYPKGNKVANAMLRQAMAFLEIKDATSSQLLLKKVIKNFPDSLEAKIAKTKLKKIN